MRESDLELVKVHYVSLGKPVPPTILPDFIETLANPLIGDLLPQYMDFLKQYYPEEPQHHQLRIIMLGRLITNHITEPKWHVFIFNQNYTNYDALFDKANALIQLYKNDMLTDDTAQDVWDHADPWQKALFLIKLRLIDFDFLDPSQKKALSQHSQPLSTLLSCCILHQARCFSEEKLTFLLKLTDQDSQKINRALTILNQSETLHLINIVLAYQDPVSAAEALRILETASLLTADYQDRVLTHRDPVSAAEALCALNEASLLTADHQDRVLTHRNPMSAAEALRILQTASLLTADHLALVLAHPYPSNAANALCRLNQESLLTDHRDRVLAHADPLNAAEALCALNEASLLTADHLNRVLAHPYPKIASEFFIALHRFHIFTPENCEAVLRAPDVYVVQDLLRHLEYWLVVLRFDNNIIQDVLAHRAPMTVIAGLSALYESHLFTNQNYAAVLANQDPEQTAIDLVRQQQWQFNVANMHAMPAADPDVINRSQSTHTASVHQSTSEMATKLKDLYGSQITTAADLENVIGRAQEFVNFLPQHAHDIKLSASVIDKDHPKQRQEQIAKENRAAQACIARITRPPVCMFKDPTSGLTILELLALSFLALEDKQALYQHAAQQDPSNKECNKPEWQKAILAACYRLFVIGLYDIEYDGPESETVNRICCAGTFNKLVEWLSSAHPIGRMIFMSPLTASLKLGPAVNHEAACYILAQPEQQHDSMLTKIEQTNSIEEIWPLIEESVRKKMFEEFKSLYTGENDPDFTGLMSAACDIDCNKIRKAYELEKRRREQAAKGSSATLFGVTASAANQETLEQEKDDDDQDQAASASSFGFTGGSGS